MKLNVNIKPEIKEFWRRFSLRQITEHTNGIICSTPRTTQTLRPWGLQTPPPFRTVTVSFTIESRVQSRSGGMDLCLGFVMLVLRCVGTALWQTDHPSKNPNQMSTNKIINPKNGRPWAALACSVIHKTKIELLQVPAVQLFFKCSACRRITNLPGNRLRKQIPFRGRPNCYCHLVFWRPLLRLSMRL